MIHQVTVEGVVLSPGCCVCSVGQFVMGCDVTLSIYSSVNSVHGGFKQKKLEIMLPMACPAVIWKNSSCFNVTRPQNTFCMHPTGNSPPLCVCPYASCVTKIARALHLRHTHTHTHTHTQTAWQKASLHLINQSNENLWLHRVWLMFSRGIVPYHSSNKGRLHTDTHTHTHAHTHSQNDRCEARGGGNNTAQWLWRAKEANGRMNYSSNNLSSDRK